MGLPRDPRRLDAVSASLEVTSRKGASPLSWREIYLAEHDEIGNNDKTIKCVTYPFPWLMRNSSATRLVQVNKRIVVNQHLERDTMHVCRDKTRDVRVTHLW